MSNEAAIVLGVQKWLEANKDFVGRRIESGAEKGIIAIAEVVGAQLSHKAARWMEENSRDLIAAIAGQVAIGALSELPSIKNKPPQNPLEPMPGDKSDS